MKGKKPGHPVRGRKPRHPGRLLLQRKVGERIVIGGGISIVVLEVLGSKVRLGIEAPLEVPVKRLETILEQGGRCP